MAGLTDLADQSKVWLSHPMGNANVRQAALALADAGLLGTFWTALAPNVNSVGRMLSRLPGMGELRRRNVPVQVAPFTRQRPLREGVRLLATRLGVEGLTRHERGWASVDAVFQNLDTAVARRIRSIGTPRAICAYEDGALASFRSARARGWPTIYDLPIGYWRAARRIAQEEAERLPEWRETLPGLRDSAEKLERKDEELRLADTIIVASRFTARTLADTPFPVSKPVVIPYGCGEGGMELDGLMVTGQERDGAPAPRPSAKKPLHVLFVGSLSQRKGIYELFKAVEALGSAVRLTLVGSLVGECAPRDRYLREHRWIPTLAHEGVLKLMREHDVLVFPSLFEGFGLVITEALSQGIPVITTAHTGGPDVLTEGKDGFLVPIRDWAAIANRLEQLHADRDLLATMKGNARRTAAVHSWAVYRRGVVQAVSSVLARSGE